MMVGAVFERNPRRQKLEISFHVKQKTIKDLFVPIHKSYINKYKITYIISQKNPQISRWLLHYNLSYKVVLIEDYQEKKKFIKQLHSQERRNAL